MRKLLLCVSALVMQVNASRMVEYYEWDGGAHPMAGRMSRFQEISVGWFPSADDQWWFERRVVVPSPDNGVVLHWQTWQNDQRSISSGDSVSRSTLLRRHVSFSPVVEIIDLIDGYLTITKRPLKIIK